ncbi:MAG: outer membrane protein assembly factor BamA, partial [Simkania sp.]|nr:outer membrane protein assembly factor BamA [Simkania sp.]
ELDIEPHTFFNRDEFNLAFNKVKEYYIKKGYFESDIEYKIIPYSDTNEIDIEITIHEGHSGHISKIAFSGLSNKEQSAILELIQTKKYNFFTSWLTGRGTYHEEALEQDKLIIVNYLQNQGYADARVNIQTKEDENGRLEIYINAVKGEKYHFGSIGIQGNVLLNQQQIERVMLIKDGSIFSPEKLRDSIQNVKDLYGKDGYIEANINYVLHLSPSEPVYSVDIQIEEGEQFRIGLIRVLGNVSTNKNVILRESLLVPGEVFDSRRLKATQMRLEAIGYFKSVNVYAVKTPDDQELGENYRDVVIEVEETTTGSLSLFGGLSTTDSIFGGIDLAENNFDHRGLTRWWREGFSALRGAGEYAQLKAQIGKKQQTYSLTWMDPYFRDTLWRFGFEASYSKNRLQSDDYDVDIVGGSIFANYPLTNYWTFGTRLRVRNSISHIDKHILNKDAQQERQNSGLIAGLSSSISYDTRDNPFKPHRGVSSYFEIEMGGVRRHDNNPRYFPFGKVSFLNSYYYPLWRKGTVKLRGDFRFLVPFGGAEVEDVALSEKFFLGGDTTVRGYKPYSIGPKFPRNKDGDDSNAPKGGISSMLLSVEYLQNVMKMLDLFVFFDGGTVSEKRFDIPDFRMSYGLGARIELGNRMPFIVGMGFPINPEDKDDVKRFFFSMGAQF